MDVDGGRMSFFGLWLGVGLVVKSLNELLVRWGSF